MPDNKATSLPIYAEELNKDLLARLARIEHPSRHIPPGCEYRRPRPLPYQYCR